METAFSTDNFYIAKKSLIFKKYIVYVDIVMKDGELSLGQKLNSFFGQAGIFENFESIIKSVEDYLKYLNNESLVFQSSNYEIGDEENVDKDFVFYLPLIMIFYFDQKKVDFYTSFFFSKNLNSINLNSHIITNYFLIQNRFLVNKLNFIHKIITYNIIVLNNSYFKKNLNTLISIKNLNYLEDEFMHNDYTKEYYDYLIKKKRRIAYLKNLKSKNRRILIEIKKQIRNVKLNFLINLAVVKVLFFNNEFNDFSLFIETVSLISSIYSISNNFLKKFKRRKRYKKSILKSNVGKKMTFYKVINYIEEKKKKRQ